MEKQYISSRQFTIIVLFYSIGTSILIIPASITKDVKQDAWIVAIVGIILSLLIIMLYNSLGSLMSNKSFVEMAETILGKFFGKLVAIVFFILTFISASELLYFLGDFLQTEIMIETPTLAFAILFSIIIMYATYAGIEVFARSVEILFPLFLIIFIVFVISTSPQIDTNNIQPFFEAPIKKLIYDIFYFMGIYSFPFIVLLMIFPSSVNVIQSSKKGFYIGAISGGIMLTVVLLLCILALGPTNTSLRSYPSYALARTIEIGNFVQRIEIIMAIMWWITIYVKAFMYFYASVKGIGNILNIKNHRPLIIPLGIISIALSQIVHPTIIHSSNYNKETWPIFAFIVAILIPLLILIVAKLRKYNNKTVDTCDTASTEQL